MTQNNIPVIETSSFERLHGSFDDMLSGKTLGVWGSAGVGTEED